MLKLFVSSLALLCLVSSMPQQGPLEITYNGIKYPLLLNTPAGFEGAPITPSDQCDGYSCNGLEYKVIRDGDDLILGQCRANVPNKTETFCFVNQDSACFKTSSTFLFQGKYISTEPCKAFNAPNVRQNGNPNVVVPPRTGGDSGTGTPGAPGTRLENCGLCQVDCTCYSDKSFWDCLLGGTQILMADHSTKSIETLKSGEFILDGRLEPVQVVEVFQNFVGNTPLTQFAPNGPVFTGAHQFVSNLEQGEVGVMNKKRLLTQNPQMEASKIHNLTEMGSLLQFKNGNIVKSGFDVVPYKTLDPSTLTYFIITNGQDGSYIADNFVTRDVMPDFQKWPLTYATLGHILTSCEINYPIDTVEAALQLKHDTKDLTENWRLAISNIDDLEEGDDFTFDFSSWIQLGRESLLKDKKKMTFAQELNENGAKILHNVLDDNHLPLAIRHALIKKIEKITMQSFTCTFKDLP